jgi:hypothetical protein
VLWIRIRKYPHHSGILDPDPYPYLIKIRIRIKIYKLDPELSFKKLPLLTSSVADPGSGAFLALGSGIGFFLIPDPKPIFLRA